MVAPRLLRKMMEVFAAVQGAGLLRKEWEQEWRVAMLEMSDRLADTTVSLSRTQDFDRLDDDLLKHPRLPYTGG